MVTRVILEGCNGDWAQKHYLPPLVEKAAQGAIALWAVDMGDNLKLGALQKDWQAARSEKRAHYLNKEKDRQRYNELSGADYVFIVVPDRLHSKITLHWLERLSPQGKIFIEKPLEASVKTALKLIGEIEARGKRDAVFAFDHYLARAYPILEENASYLEKIGEVSRIEFRLLEASPISPQRIATLDKGMVFDLFCHGLALVGAVLDRTTTCSAATLQAINIKKVTAAQYADSPISSETFAWIMSQAPDDTEIVAALGKCVGKSDDKSLVLEGANGKAKLDFDRDTFTIFNSQGRQIKNGELFSRHVESFLDDILSGKKHPLSAPGVLGVDAALEILNILDEAKKRITKTPEYQCSESTDEILERLKRGD